MVILEIKFLDNIPDSEAAIYFLKKLNENYHVTKQIMAQELFTNPSTVGEWLRPGIGRKPNSFSCWKIGAYLRMQWRAALIRIPGPYSFWPYNWLFIGVQDKYDPFHTCTRNNFLYFTNSLKQQDEYLNEIYNYCKNIPQEIKIYQNYEGWSTSEKYLPIDIAAYNNSIIAAAKELEANIPDPNISNLNWDVFREYKDTFK